MAIGLVSAAELVVPRSVAAQELPAGRFGGPPSFVLTIGRDGAWSVGQANGPRMVSGTYRIVSGQLELSDNPGPRACADGTGRYTWKFQADTLRAVLTPQPSRRATHGAEIAYAFNTPDTRHCLTPSPFGVPAHRARGGAPFR